jgi:L-asparaginase/Glu-tRNA(Gln) amidotransferase subunit D
MATVVFATGGTIASRHRATVRVAATPGTTDHARIDHDRKS